jgi:polysaccharide export outer membrane protein
MARFQGSRRNGMKLAAFSMPLRAKRLARLLLFAGGLIVVPMIAQSRDPVGPPASVETLGTPNQPSAQPLPECVISVDDVLAVSVYDIPEVSGEYRVSPAGEIQLPLLPLPVVAVGQTPAQLADLIGRRFRDAEVVIRPRVTVAIRESRVHAITIAGAVRRPQIYPVFGKTTLLDILSQAEGLADDAGTLALISRGAIALGILGEAGEPGSAGKVTATAHTFTVDLSRLTATGDPLLNVDLYPGDKVTVQRAGIVYVVGAVNRPGGFALKPGQEHMTVIQAVALAEDLKPIASRKKAAIIRQNPSAANGSEEIPVDLSKLLSARNRDLRLQANDILFVPESAGEKALRRGSEAAITAATWGIIYRW